MGSKWRKAKLALGLNRCVLVPRTLDDSPPSLDGSERLSDAALLSPASWASGPSGPSTPTPSSHGLRLSRSGSKSSKVSNCLPYEFHGCGVCLFVFFFLCFWFWSFSFFLIFELLLSLVAEEMEGEDDMQSWVRFSMLFR